MGETLKLSSQATGQFWEIPILHQDGDLLALDKPAGLAVSPSRTDSAKPSLMELLHRDIARGAGWAKSRGVTYLANSHRLEADTTGVILLALNKPALVALANQFGADKPVQNVAALVRGSCPEEEFVCDAKIGAHPLEAGIMRVDSRTGMKARTEFKVLERFGITSCTLLECRPVTHRTDQIRAHLKYIRLPVIGDDIYGGSPLLLSALKAAYHLKRGHTERPLIARTALHAGELRIAHPVTGAETVLVAPWPKDFDVSVKYLRRYANSRA